MEKRKQMKTVRMATKTDIPAILEIYRPYIESTVVTFEYETPSLEAFTKRVQTIMEKYPWLVCEMNGEIVGYAYASDYHERSAFAWDCEISVYVDCKKQHKGIGSALYQILLPLLKKLGYYQVYAVICVPNQASQTMHHNFGFQSVAVFEKAGFKHGKWRDLEYQVLQLRPMDEPAHFPISMKALAEEEINFICQQ